MTLRSLLLGIGGALVFLGLGVIVVWIGQPVSPPELVKPETPRHAVLVATRDIPAGSLLRKDDMEWKDVDPTSVRPGNIVRGQADETEFHGAVSRHDIADGEPLIGTDLIKPNDRRFLSVVLHPDTRAVSIAVDAPQSVTGLAQPDDRVDVILTQSFEEKFPRIGATARSPSGDAIVRRPEGDVTIGVGHKMVGETVVRDVRIIAVDRSLEAQTPTVVAPRAGAPAESPTPRTITLELSERQAEKLLVAAQLGRFQLSLRPLRGAAASRPRDEREGERRPVWASDVSAALEHIERLQAAREPPPKGEDRATPEPRSCDPKASLSGSTLECLVRRPFEFSRGGPSRSSAGEKVPTTESIAR